MRAVCVDTHGVQHECGHAHGGVQCVETLMNACNVSVDTLMTVYSVSVDALMKVCSVSLDTDGVQHECGHT